MPAFHLTLRDYSHGDFVVVPNGNHVIFQKNHLDISKSYNSQTGVYTVTTSGVYVLTWTVAMAGPFQCDTHLMVNDSYKGDIVTFGSSPGPSNDASTGVVVTSLLTGDQVYIKQFGSTTCTMRHDIFRQTSFSGWFLHK